MSLTAELFGSTAPSTSSTTTKAAAVAEKPNENVESTSKAISFEPTKKASFDLFALAPQVKKASRKEKQRLRGIENLSANKGERGVGESGKEKESIFATVFLDDDKDNKKDGADKNGSKRKKHLRHALHKNEEEESRTVFLGNLVNDVKKRTIEKIFKNCGTIECVRIRAQALEEEEDGPSKNNNNNNNNNKSQKKGVGRAIRILRGEIKKGDEYSAVAYVLFKEKASVTKALEKNGIVVDGRHIVVTTMDPESAAYAPNTSIFIGNISYDTNEEMVWNFFVEKGVADVKRVRLIRDRDTGKCKGFGYVEFHHTSSVSKAIAVRGSLLNGREVRIVHVQKSKAVGAIQVSRREKRKREEQTTAGHYGKGDGKNENRKNNMKKNNNNNNNNKRSRREEKGDSTRQTASRDDQPSWMGVVTNPRKKIPKDLRPLVEGKKARQATGPRAPVKHKMRNPEK